METKAESEDKHTEERTETHACDCKTHGRTHACDCISRQAVSDIIKTRLYQTALNNDEYITSYAKVCEDIAENRIDTWINEAKSVKSEKCGDLISRQAAIDAFEKFIHELGIEDEPYNYGEMALSAQNVPSAEPERKMGKWIEKEGYDGDVYYDCSVCGNSWTTIDGTPWDNGMNYCPNCGARMEVQNDS